jgi:hypothetical protein
MTSWKFFCDEAGNTGSNIADLRQPVHVLGGWMVQDSNVPAFEAFISGQRTSGSELKATHILNRPEGWTWGAEFLKGLAKTGGVPFFVLLEKRYAAAAKMIEFFLNPSTNPLIMESFTRDADAKQEIAERIYAMQDSILMNFARAYHTRDRAGIVEVYGSLVRALDDRDADLAEWFRGAETNLDKIIALELGQNRAIRSMNLPVFFSTISMLESLGRNKGMTSIEVVHDETPEFSSSFDRAFDLLKNGSDQSVMLDNGAEYHGRLRILKSLRFAVSHESAGIQAAEVLIGGLFRMGASAASEDEMPGEMKPFAELTLPAFLEPEPRIAWSSTSRPFIKKLLSILEIQQAV